MRLKIAKYTYAFLAFSAVLTVSAQGANLNPVLHIAENSRLLSSEKIVLATAPQNLPPQPENIAAVVSDTSVTISWTAVKGMSYSVFRSTGGDPAKVKLSENLKTGKYVDKSVKPGAYTYVVTALANGYSSVTSLPAYAAVNASSSPESASGSAPSGTPVANPPPATVPTATAKTPPTPVTVPPALAPVLSNTPPKNTSDPESKTSAPWGEAILGLDVSGASSTDAKAVFLGQGLLDWTFLGSGDGPNHDGTAGFFAQLRVAGMAQPGNLSGNIGTLSAFTTYLAAADNATPDKIVQSIEGGMGVGVQIAHHHLPGEDLITGSFIASLGALTPLSASQVNPPVYSLTNQILQQFSGQIQGNSVSGCAYTSGSPTCYVAFIPQDRTHFYRHYEAGFRLKLYEKAASGSNNTYVFPGNLDITFGQNEYVTKGKLSGIVLHVGGMIPVPRAPYIYGYGAIDTTMSGESLQNDAEQLLLSPAPSSANLTYLSPSVYTISVGQPKRDRYRLGFGVDIIHLYQAIQNKGKATPPA